MDKNAIKQEIVELQTRITDLQRQLVIPRFLTVIRDTETGHEWMVGPDKDTDFLTAKRWIESLPHGEGWRMPMIAELKTLYQPGVGERNMYPVFSTTGWFAWASDECNDSSRAWYVGFYRGDEYRSPRDYSPNYRVFSVRSGRRC